MTNEPSPKARDFLQALCVLVANHKPINVPVHMKILRALGYDAPEIMHRLMAFPHMGVTPDGHFLKLHSKAEAEPDIIYGFVTGSARLVPSHLPGGG